MAPRVIIVGGGVSGLTLAALLAQRRFREVVLIERVVEYKDVGYVLGMWGNGLRILKGLGKCYEELMKIGSVIHNFLILDDNGDHLSNFELDDLNKRFEPAVMIKRAELLAILMRHIRANTNVDVRLGSSITRIEQDEKSARVTLTSGEELECDIVVGSDGIHSVTRRIGGFGDVPLTFWNFRGCGFWVDARECNKLDTQTVIEMWGPDGQLRWRYMEVANVNVDVIALTKNVQMFGIYPHGDHIVAACCTLHCDAPDQGAARGWRNTHTSHEMKRWASCGGAALNSIAQPDPDDARIAKIRHEFRNWGGPVPSILKAMEHPEDFYSDDLCELTMEGDCYNGRVVLIGDAAHAILPTAGAGAALGAYQLPGEEACTDYRTAMESAGVLAEELCWCDGSNMSDVQRTMVNYQARRKPRVHTVRTDSNTLADAITWSNTAAVVVRNLMMRQASPMTFSKKMLKLMYDPI